MKIYTVLALVIILILTGLSLYYWQDRFDLYLDVYDIAYHLAVMVGFDRAGGFVTYNFWEWAPFGEPHYYPPTLHILGLFLLRAGVRITDIAYWLTWLLYPLGLISVWLWLRIVFDSKMALYSIILMTIPLIWIEKIWGHSAYGLLLVILPLTLLCIELRLFKIATLLILVSICTHLAGIIVPLVVFVYALHRKELRKSLFIILGIIVVCSLPGIWIGIKRIIFSKILVGSYLAISPFQVGFRKLLYLFLNKYAFFGSLAILGLVICYKLKGKYLVFPSLLFSISCFLWTPKSGRFIYGFNLLPFSLLGGLALRWLDNQILAVSRKKFVSIIFLIMVIGMGNFLFPKLSSLPGRSARSALLTMPRKSVWVPYKLLFSGEQKVKVAKLAKKVTFPDEFIYVDSSQNSSRIISAISRRSVTIDNLDGPGMIVTRKIEGFAHLKLIERIDSWSVYLTSPETTKKVEVVTTPIISFSQICFGLGLCLGIVLWDIIGNLLRFFTRPKM